MKRSKSIVLALLAVFVAVAYTPVYDAGAQSSSLSIAPRKDYVIKPGQSVDDKLTIRNLDRVNDLSLYLQVIDFTYTDDGGTPKLLLDQDAEPTPWSLKNNIKLPTVVNVKAGASATIDINVKMQPNIGGGSYYSAIVYSTSAPSGGNLGLAASGVTLAFVSVPGPVNEDLKLEKFGAYDPAAKKYNFFAVNEPNVIGYTLKNNGNVFEAPVGTITLKSMFGQEYKIENINPNKSLALIGQTRTFQACIKLAAQKVDFQGQKTDANTCVSPGLWPGMYTVSIAAFYGQNGNVTKEINKTTVFWYMPLWFIIVLSITLLVAVFYIWRTVVFLRGGSFKIGGRPKIRTSSSRRR